MEWIARCVSYSAAVKNGGAVHTVMLRGKDPAVELVVQCKDELPFHIDQDYVLTCEPLDGDFV